MKRRVLHQRPERQRGDPRGRWPLERALPALGLLLVLAACTTLSPEPPVSVVAISTSLQRPSIAAAPEPAAPPPAAVPAVAPAPAPAAPRPIPVPAVAASMSSAAERAELQRALDETRAHLRARRLGPAKARLEAASALAAGLGARARLRMLQLATELHLAAGELDEAEAAGLGWLGSCDASPACRRDSFKALRRIARGPPARRTLASRLGELGAADRCLASARAKPAKALPCLGAAETTYEQAGDKLQLAQLALVRARRIAAADRKGAIAAFTAAAGRCEEERCSGVRREALRRLIALHTAAGELAAAAGTALLENELAIGERHPEDPVHERSKAVRLACAAHDAAAGAGSCRALERRLLGHHSFVDFSVATSRGSLGLQQIRDVAHEYGVLLEPCLALEAEGLTPPTTSTLALRWRVLRTGRVDEVHLSPPERDTEAFAVCARTQFVHWRYPRPSAPQQLEQTFTVNAVAPAP